MSKPPPDPVFTLRGHVGPISHVHFPSQNCHLTQSLLSTSSVGEMYLWDLKSFRVHTKCTAHDKKNILWTGSLDGRIFSQGRDGNLCTWMVENGEFVQIASRPHNSIGFCKCSLLKDSGSSLLACPTKNMSAMEILDVATMKVVMTTDSLLNNDQKHGMCMCCKLFVLPHSTSPMLICGFENGRLVLFSVKDRCLVSETKVQDNPVMCLDVDAEFRQKCVTASVEKEIVVTDCSNLDLSVVQRVSVMNAGINSVTIRGDGKIACSGGADHRLRIFSWKNMRSLAVLDYHSDQIQCTEFSQKMDSSNDYILAAGSLDKKISLWSLYNS